MATITRKNAFIGSLHKGNTFTENGAVSNSSSGLALVDQFGKAGAHRGRDLKTVWVEQAQIWGENPTDSVKFIYYLRLVTRKTKGFEESELVTKVQSGQGARDEAFKRLLWVAKYHPDTFYKNLWLIPLVGSWKDLFTLMAIGWEEKLPILDHNKVFELLEKGLNDSNNKALVLKYMPSIKANSKCKTERAKTLNGLAKGFASYLRLTPEEYRKFKATGEAHRFQRLIAAGLYDQIKWNEIPGKALFNLIKGKFLEKHNLTSSYEAWLDTQPVAKFTGYVHELGHQVKTEGTKISRIKKKTYDKQFSGLIELAKKNEGGIKGNVWCALDTSGSMTNGSSVDGVTPIEICLSLGIYFSTLNVGTFHKHVIMFDSVSKVAHLKGDSFVDQYQSIQRDAMGSTNFQSVIDEIVRIRKTNPSIPVEDYPETLLVVSDMQFDPSGRNSYYGSNMYVNQYNRFTGQMERVPSTNGPTDSISNYEMAMKKLADVGLPKIKIIWWDCVGRKSDVPSTISDEGTTLISGFDGSILTLLLGGEQTIKDSVTGKVREKTMEEKVQDALNQEILSQITL
jgi:hypothetical protein